MVVLGCCLSSAPFRGVRCSNIVREVPLALVGFEIALSIGCLCRALCWRWRTSCENCRPVSERWLESDVSVSKLCGGNKCLDDATRPHSSQPVWSRMQPLLRVIARLQICFCAGV